jgi:hypothetical protein
MWLEDVAAAASLIAFGVMMLVWAAIIEHPEWIVAPDWITP